MSTIWNAVLGRKGLGAKRDWNDPQDYRLAALALAPIDGDVDLSRPESPIRDQGPTGSCVGQSLVTGVQLAYLAGGIDCQPLSALDSYYRARALEGGTISDVGAYPRLALKALQNSGVASEAAWPFSVRRVNKRPSWGARRDGYPLRGVRGYYSCWGPDEIALAVRHKRPVQVCMSVTDVFMRLRKHDYVYEMTGVPLGGHAMLVSGVETVAGELRFRIQNSWGTGWGNGGFWTASAKLITEDAHDCRAIDVEAA